jgi:hypothetical protein
VVAAYVSLAAAPFVFAATHASFWKHEHSAAPVASAVVAALLIALVLRQRWAWLVLVVIQVLVLLSFAFDFAGAFAFLLNLASMALLVSPPMRRYVRRRGANSA